MAILLTLVVECGSEEAHAKHIADALNARLGTSVETQWSQEGEAWWVVGYLMEWSRSRKASQAEVLALGDRAYGALAELGGYRFALLDWESEQFRTYEELASGDLNSRGGINGLVVERALWTAGGSPPAYVPFAPGYMWKPPEPEVKWLGIRDLRKTPGFVYSFAPVRAVVEKDGVDASQAGLIRDRRSSVKVSDEATPICLDLLPRVKHVAAREALLRLLPDGYWRPGLGRLLAESAAAMTPDYLEGGDAEYDIVSWHLVQSGDHLRQPDVVLSELITLLTAEDLKSSRAWILRALMSCNTSSARVAEAVRPLIEDPDVGALAFQVYTLQGNHGLDKKLWERYSAHPNAAIAERANDQLRWLEERSKRLGEKS
jgi:hypothetical protein